MATLTNLDMAVTGSFSVGSLSFNADDLTVTYAAASDTYTIAGAADFSVGGDAIDVVFGGTTSQGTTTQGLVIHDGTLTNLDMAVTGSFSVGSLSFNADDLTVTYAAASETYTIDGAADFSVGGDAIDVVFGGTTSQGTATNGLVIHNGDPHQPGHGGDGLIQRGPLLSPTTLLVTYATASETYTIDGAADSRRGGRRDRCRLRRDHFHGDLDPGAGDPGWRP